MTKFYAESARPSFFSKKPHVSPGERGDTGKGPLPKIVDKGGELGSRHTNDAAKAGRKAALGAEGIRPDVKRSARPTPVASDGRKPGAFK